ncbi:type IVB secretion system protein IcmH/DotU [Enterovibrio nigricans]|uniref:Type VI secretion system protein ImpK n=1 Tax=Enterovibrio nigricans DSM 22720 TaxID=1121868 RepID=A0A1T4UFZ2_9GAMM|nr:type IVB secretion system protein IcmH/DotU [Enterovibrio nigricans]PKF51071.1 type VI secretion protein [Enterovibrio nigricans]SKA51516.1 type VI secretion system protein ImpK [Enterovibrio nigricans DSM 22720]
MSYIDDDVTVVLFQPEPGKPMEVMPPPDLSRNIAVSGLDLDAIGVNPLVDQFSWLIATLSCMSSIPWLDDPMPFREQVAREIRKGERKLDEMEVERATILVVRYCLCAAFDEAVLSQQWGADSRWSQNSLLAEFHNETSGGDKFFIILERLKNEPKKYRYVIEFLYLLLQMGFKGKFGREGQGGKEALVEISQVIYRLVRDDRLLEKEKLSLVDLKTKYLKQPLKKVVPPKLTLLLTAGILIAMHAAAYITINGMFQKIIEIYK